MANKLKPFTVILLYPDYCTDTFGQDNWMSTVEAADPVRAVIAARKQCLKDNKKEFGSKICDAEDLFVIAVLEGDHVDVKPTIYA